MNCEHAAGLIADRLMGSLNDEDSRRLESHLGGCADCRREAEDLGVLWRGLGDFHAEVPHERMRARFYAALAAHDERRTAAGLERLVDRLWPRRPAFQAAIAAAMLVAGVVAGVVAGRVAPSPLESEIVSLRSDVRAVSLALLDHQSASERLLGVEWSRRATSYAPVSDALLDAVRNDRNVNVRLAAVEALSDWVDRPEVAVALTEALARDPSPLMQVTLAEVLLAGNVDGSVSAVEALLARDDVEPAVREHLTNALEEVGNAAPGGEIL